MEEEAAAAEEEEALRKRRRTRERLLLAPAAADIECWRMWDMGTASSSAGLWLPLSALPQQSSCLHLSPLLCLLVALLLIPV